MNGLMQYAAGMKKQFTATGYVVNQDRSRMLMIFHNMLGFWLPPGGHVDPDEFPDDAALREVREETGLEVRHVGAHTVDLGLGAGTEAQLPTPFAMAAQLIPASHKDVEHIHMDLMYLLEGDDAAPLTARETEVRAARWFTRAEVLNGLSTPDSVRAFARQQLSEVPIR